MVDYIGNNLEPERTPSVDPALPIKLDRRIMSITELLQQPRKVIEEHGQNIRWYHPPFDKCSVYTYLVNVVNHYQDLEDPYEHVRVIKLLPEYDLFRWEGRVHLIKKSDFSETFKPNLKVPPSQRLKRGGPRIIYQLPPRELEDRRRIIHLPPIGQDELDAPPPSSPVELAPPRWYVPSPPPPTRSISTMTSSILHHWNGYTYPQPDPITRPTSPKASRPPVPLQLPFASIPVQSPVPARVPVVGAESLLSNIQGIPDALEVFPGPSPDEYEDGTPVEMQVDEPTFQPTQTEANPMKIVYPPLPRGCATPPPIEPGRRAATASSYHEEYPPQSFSPGLSWLHKQEKTLQTSHDNIQKDFNLARREVADMLLDVALAEAEVKEAKVETSEWVKSMKDQIGPKYDFDGLMAQAKKAARGDPSANDGAVGEAKPGFRVHIARKVKKLPRRNASSSQTPPAMVGSPPPQQIQPSVHGSGNVVPANGGVIQTNLGPAARREKELQEAQALPVVDTSQVSRVPKAPPEQTLSQRSSSPAPTAVAIPIENVEESNSEKSPISPPSQVPTVIPAPPAVETLPPPNSPADSHALLAAAEDLENELEYVEDPKYAGTCLAEGSAGPSKDRETTPLFPGYSRPKEVWSWDTAYGGEFEFETWYHHNPNFTDAIAVHVMDPKLWGRPVPEDECNPEVPPGHKVVYLPPPGYSSILHSARYRGQKRHRKVIDEKAYEEEFQDPRKVARYVIEEGADVDTMTACSNILLPESESEAVFTNLSDGYSSSDTDSIMGDPSVEDDDNASKISPRPPTPQPVPFVEIDMADNDADSGSEYQADAELSDAESSAGDDDDSPPLYVSLIGGPTDYNTLKPFFDQVDREARVRRARGEHAAPLQPTPSQSLPTPALNPITAPTPTPAPTAGPSRGHGLRRANEMVYRDASGQPATYIVEQAPSFVPKMRSSPDRFQIRPLCEPLHPNHDKYIADNQLVTWDVRGAGWSGPLFELVDQVEEEGEEIEEIEEAEFLGIGSSKGKGKGPGKAI